MDTEILKQGMDLIAGQGPLFLAAAGAVAAGLTLLVVSLFVYLRGRRPRRRRPMIPRRRPDVGKGADTYCPRQPATSSPASTGEPVLDQALLARLQRTTTQLEKLQLALRRGRTEAAESSLKALPPAVEYVFKKGIG